MGKEVVEGENMGTSTCEGIQIGGQDRSQRLPFPGLHLRELCLVHGDSRDDLHVEGTQAQYAPGGFPYDRKRFDEQITQASAESCPPFRLRLTIMLAAFFWVHNNTRVYTVFC